MKLPNRVIPDRTSYEFRYRERVCRRKRGFLLQSRRQGRLALAAGLGVFVLGRSFLRCPFAFALAASADALLAGAGRRQRPLQSRLSAWRGILLVVLQHIPCLGGLLAHLGHRLPP